jgi:Putative metal-binding motif
MRKSLLRQFSLLTLICLISISGCAYVFVDEDDDGPSCIDSDGDGYGEGCNAGPDCNDSDPSINPAADEIPYDGIDNDCNPETPDDDLDGDGFALADDCDDEHPAHWSDCDTCSDSDGDGFGDRCNLGEDCIDTDSNHWADCGLCIDADGDSYGQNCDLGDDCDDSNPAVNPDAPELPDDGIDTDCIDGDLVAANEVGIFVSPQGNDGSAGTMDDPVYSIARAAELADEEEKSVFVAAGSYEESVELSVSLFGGYNSAGWSRDIAANTTTIVGPPDVMAPIIVVEGANVAVEGFTFNAGAGAQFADIENCSSMDCSAALLIMGSATVANCTINGGISNMSGAIYVKGRATIVNNLIYAGKGEFGAAAIAVLGQANIIDNEIHGSDDNIGMGSMGVLVGGSYGHANIIGNRIFGGSGGTYTFGVWMQPVMGAILPAQIQLGTTAMIKNNEINGGSGAETVNPIRLIHSMATIEGNTITSGTSGHDTHGIELREGARAFIKNNIIRPGDAPEESNAVRIAESDSYKGTTTAILVNNIIEAGSGASSNGVRVTSSSSALLINNLISAGNAERINLVLLDGTSEIELVNNIFRATNETSGEIRILTSNSDANPNTFVVESNNFSDIEGACLFYKGGCVASEIDVLEQCLWDGCEVASGNLNESPGFINAAAGNYHLESGSACIDAGIDPSGILPEEISDWAGSDFDGNSRPQGTTWDLGPYENNR